MKNTNKKVHRFLPRLGAAAAVFVLAFLVVSLAGRITRQNDSSESSNVQTESDGILTASLTGDDAGTSVDDTYDSGSTNTESGSADDSGSTNAENEASDGSDSADTTAEVTEGSDIAETSGAATGNTDDDVSVNKIRNSPENNTDTDADADSAEAETEVVAADDASAIATVSADTADPFPYASSYEEIYEAIYELYSDVDMAYGVAADYDGASSDTSSFARSSGSSNASSSSATADAAEEEVMAIEDSMEDVADTGASDDTDYSTTNIQEAGVDEADIVKTDGTYIYILRTSGEFLIVRAGGEMELVSQTAIESDNDLNARALYLDGDTLSVITSEYATSLGST
ncbi:MAG: beta-propeller domain-containing protein, partial [Lachnospiraceae bacterium]|nr:beta-propeller domain-containing protein [Lachnospiraceae bacterium]